MAPLTTHVLRRTSRLHCTKRTDPPASAGPYYITAHENGGTTLLSHNPNTGSRIGAAPETIMIDESISPSEAAAKSIAGAVQHSSFDDPSFRPASDLARTADQKSAHTYHASPLMGVHYVAFNSRRPPLDNPLVRAGIAESLDPSGLSDGRSAVPSRWLLPTGVFATPTRLSAPAARQERPTLHRPLTLGYQYGCGTCAVDAHEVAQQLGAHGIQVRIRPYDELSAAQDLDLAIGQTHTPYPDPASFLDTMLSDDVPSTWIDEEVHRQLEHLANLTGDTRTREALRLADELTVETPVAVYGTAVMGELLAGLTCPEIPGSGLDLINCTRHPLQLP